MAVQSKIFSEERGATPLTVNLSQRRLSAYRRYFVWTEIVVVFVFLELALWAPTTKIRNRWAAITAFAIVVFTLLDAATGRTSLRRLGLRLPKIADAAWVVGIGLATAALLLFFADWAGGQIPANPSWFPDLRSASGYVIWATVQEFILLAFFFNRFEELRGGSEGVWMASTLFAAVHLPSPVLTTATLFAAPFFCEMFRRSRSIYPIALVHAMLGLTVALIVPDSLLHHMRVGIGYLRY
jgi:membrane protease YdiL (CAAX protease family)